MHATSERRIIIGPCRSGTTMLLRSIKNHPDAVVEFQTVKDGQRRNGKPDYGFFYRQVPAGKFLVNKETVGYGNDADCALEVFPDDDAIRQCRPVFLFRRPCETFASWIENNLVCAERKPDLFIKAYRHTFELLLRARGVCSHASVLTYEALCQNPKQHVRQLCDRWAIAFHLHMVHWQEALDTASLDSDGVREGHYRTVMRESEIRPPQSKSALDAECAQRIEDALGRTYEEIVSLVRIADTRS